MKLAYLTDVEGRWDKLVDFAAHNPYVSMDAAGRLVVAAGATFVFGGDSVDRGPAGRRVVEALIDVYDRQPHQVVLIAGNRDINKLRLARELGGHPPAAAPEGLSRPALLQWIFANTMGAGEAFGMRQRELGVSDEEVVASFMADVAPDGCMRRYLERAQLAVALGAVLIVHGGISDESLGRVPGHSTDHDDVHAWIAALNEWYRGQLAAFATAPMSLSAWQPLIAYQAPVSGTNDNPASVVYRRMLDGEQRPVLPSLAARQRLARGGLFQMLVGHTPMGDVPTIARTAAGDPMPFVMVMADNSYSRLERGSAVVCGEGGLATRGRVRLDDGTELVVHGELAASSDATPLGRRDVASGELVKGRTSDARWHLFRHIANRQVEQTALTDAELAARTLG